MHYPNHVGAGAAIINGSAPVHPAVLIAGSSQPPRRFSRQMRLHLQRARLRVFATPEADALIGMLPFEQFEGLLRDHLHYQRGKLQQKRTTAFDLEGYFTSVLDTTITEFGPLQFRTREFMHDCRVCISLFSEVTISEDALIELSLA
jgi:hypothetical protein